jgi:pimeloyl-ACP methyl ester carboxylesterase
MTTRASTAAAFLAFGLAACSSGAPPPAAKDPGAPSSAAPSDRATKKRTVNGFVFAYETHGDGVPLVFLHGLPSDRRSMIARFEAVFSPSSRWRRIYVDLQGAGETGPAPGVSNIDDAYAATAAFIDAETADAKKVGVVGMSYGTILGLAYATKHPDRIAGLALFGPGFSANPEVPPRTVLVKEAGVFDGEPPQLEQAMNDIATVHTKAMRDLFKRDILPGVASVDMAFAQKIFTSPFPSFGKDLPTFRTEAPTLVVAGRQDSNGGYADAVAWGVRQPRATLVVVDRAGHAVADEQRDLVRAHFREWLARVHEGLGEKYEE